MKIREINLKGFLGDRQREICKKKYREEKEREQDKKEWILDRMKKKCEETKTQINK